MTTQYYDGVFESLDTTRWCGAVRVTAVLDTLTWCWTPTLTTALAFDVQRTAFDDAGLPAVGMRVRITTFDGDVVNIERWPGGFKRRFACPACGAKT